MLKEPDGSNIFSTLKNWFTRKVKNTQMAATAMMPKWQELEGLVDSPKERRSEVMLEKLDQVCFCVRNCFLNEDSRTEESCLKEVSHCIYI